MMSYSEFDIVDDKIIPESSFKIYSRNTTEFIFLFVQNLRLKQLI